MLALAGCVSVPPAPDFGQFALKGKVAVREGGERFSANLLWTQRDDGFEMDLWGPLGQGRVQLVKQGGVVMLTDGAGQVLTRGDPDTVMRAHLGWSLPVEVLPAWVQGRPYAAVESESLAYDGEGRLISFDQLGWRVVLDRFRTVAGKAESRVLPGRITAASERGQLRLVISEWQI
jgi:outer membrane lipoprotein LolB